MADIYTHISKVIRDLREKKGLSQEALAAAISEPSNTVSRWETETYRPSAEQLEKLARFFKVSITAFFPGMEKLSDVPAALASATRGLKKDDLEEVIRYAEFRKARSALKQAKAKPKAKGERDGNK
ncbi:helix-turn-helix domain-containing protein [Methyloceanibacter marginalis]|uniref:helix-turn-helix domain-containing protein n=1 Tax=Methyloceanibacter marginalis TaxID=1774971 RepID=UPI00130102A5|nr:helix-turn-helix transcriptional regulator [Methyloceanibacter marginalis]